MPRVLIDTLDNLNRVMDVERYLGKTIVFTNGCFDIVHAGHIEFFEKAKAYGDILVVGLNSDASIRMLKGEGRPIHNEQERSYLLGSIQYIDYIYIFDGERCGEVIRAASPHIYVKGNGYTEDSLEQSEKQAIIDSGARIEIVRTTEYATTEILKKVNGID